MKTAGLFTRQAARKAVKQKHTISNETLKQLGPEAVKRMNPKAITPAMKPTGSNEPLVYVLFDKPNEADDDSGNHASGSVGRLLRSNLPSGYEETTRFNCTCRTRTPNDRPANEVEIEAFRDSIEKDIARTKPKVVIAFGMSVVQWAIGKFKGLSMGVASGRTFPIEIQGHKCLMLALYSPAQIAASLNGYSDDISKADLKAIDRKNRKAGIKGFGTQNATAWRNYLHDAFERSVRTDEEVRVISPEDAKKDIEGVLADSLADGSIERLEQLVDAAIETGSFAIDLETSRFRTYYKNAKIVSCAIGSKAGTFGFCIDHPKQDWGPNKKKVWELFRRLCESECLKIAHNLPFDLEWICHKLQSYELLIKGRWRCTQAQAYILDNRVGGHSLHFLSTQRFGLRVKDLTDVNRTSPQNEDPAKLLLYNGIDSKITYQLYYQQNDLIKQSGKLGHANKTQQERIPPFVAAQVLGFPIDQGRVRDMRRGLETVITSVGLEIEGSKAVQEFKARYGPFNPSAPKQVSQLYKEVLGKTLTTTKGKKAGKESSDESALKAVGGKLSGLLLKHRKAEKKLGTYVTPYDSESEENNIWSDGLIHTNFNLTRTTTGRISSDKPNLTNLPKRDPEARKIRHNFVALPGYGFIAADQGQIEYRVIGMATGDKTICESCFSGFDIHMYWTKKIIKAYPRVFEKRHGDKEEAKALKDYRNEIKNQWVFPQFYGASFRSCANSLEIPEAVAADLAEELWEKHDRVKHWQKETYRKYELNGYVEALNGRRRYGPMGYNEIINSGIQGFASDITIDGMVRMTRTAIEAGREDSCPRINIYDDLTAQPKLEHINWAAKKLVRSMLSCDFPAINVPLVVELSAGRDWLNMKEIGTYRSDQLETIKDINVMKVFGE